MTNPYSFPPKKRKLSGYDLFVAVVTLILIVPLTLWGWLVSYHAWTWIVVPLVGAPALTYWQVAALTLTFTLWTGSYARVTKSDVRSVLEEFAPLVHTKEPAHGMIDRLGAMIGWLFFTHVFVWIFATFAV